MILNVKGPSLQVLKLRGGRRGTSVKGSMDSSSHRGSHVKEVYSGAITSISLVLLVHQAMSSNAETESPRKLASCIGTLKDAQGCLDAACLGLAFARKQWR